MTPPPPPNTRICLPPRDSSWSTMYLKYSTWTSLVRADGDALHVFLECRRHDFVHGAVVAQVDDFAPMLCRMRRMMLMGRVVAIEQRCSGHEAHLVRRANMRRGS